MNVRYHFSTQLTTNNEHQSIFFWPFLNIFLTLVSILKFSEMIDDVTQSLFGISTLLDVNVGVEPDQTEYFKIVILCMRVVTGLNSRSHVSRNSEIVALQTVVCLF